ncbi:MAG: hypothetical protein CMH26_02055 [Micavibrio sp.]|nr:hypothetical protein [Micavibrio sp.]|tara:strand:+ start:211 stop:435 length:225 start_codon:yes stop_codon:yes gene_type:complete
MFFGRKYKNEKVKFNIIEEYAALSPGRKKAICDQIYTENKDMFEKMVRLHWPKVEQKDIDKLRSFMKLLVHTKA